MVYVDHSLFAFLSKMLLFCYATPYQLLIVGFVFCLLGTNLWAL